MRQLLRDVKDKPVAFTVDGPRGPARKAQPGAVWLAQRTMASDKNEAADELATVIAFPYRDIYQSGALHVAQTFGVPIVASAVAIRVNVSSAEDVDSRGNAEVEFSGADSSADSLRIDPTEGGRYLVTANAAAQEVSGQKIATDQVAHRKMAGLAGIEYSYTFNYASLHFQALSDFTSVHGGHEVRAAVIFPWQLGEHKWAVTLGGNYKSRHILDYYYGISARDTDIETLYFSPTSAGVEGMVRLDWQLPLNDHWSLRAMLQYSELPDVIANSPLVSERGVGSAFFGGIYHF
mgnify:CR=1 FL=1